MSFMWLFYLTTAIISETIFEELLNATYSNNISRSKCLIFSPFSFMQGPQEEKNFQLKELLHT